VPGGEVHVLGEERWAEESDGVWGATGEAGIGGNRPFGREQSVNRLEALSDLVNVGAGEGQGLGKVVI
jgi:hypothetical protein